MKGEFFVEFPKILGENGSATYKIMYQANPESEPVVAQESTIGIRSLGDNIERTLESIATSFYYKAVAGCLGLKDLWAWRAPADPKALLDKAVKYGELKITKENASIIFANGLARAAKETGTDVIKTYQGKDTSDTVPIPQGMAVPTAEFVYGGPNTQSFVVPAEDETQKAAETPEARLFDLNSKTERDAATKAFWGDTFEDDKDK